MLLLPQCQHMGNFNIQNPPNNIPDLVQWLVQGQQILFGRTTALQSSSSTSGGQLHSLFDHYDTVGNVGTSETDLYSDTIPGGTLATDGDKIQFVYGGTYAGALANKTIKVYFAGSALLNTGGLGLETGSWQVTGTIIRSDNERCRYTVELHASDAVYVSAGSFGNTSQTTPMDPTADNILKVTGTSDGATNQVFATMGIVSWISHA